MEDLVFLCHRIPWPPDKGDKIRSAHLLTHLARSYRVHLATFVDDPRDWSHVERVRELAGGDCLFRRRTPKRDKIVSLSGLLTGEALSCRYYDDRAIDAWLGRIMATYRPAALLAFSSTMAQYVLRAAESAPISILDMVDVDSQKFGQYAAQRRGVAAWIYGREAEKLLSHERRAAHGFDHTVLVTAAETALFSRLAPDVGLKLRTITNGVDQDRFRPDPTLPNPYHGGGPRLLFTGAMDYPPNSEAAAWFIANVMPEVATVWPNAQFWVVGSNPPEELRRLASDAVHVTGRVPDMQPYLQHSDLVVAPMLTARGVQNKILEGMAMGRPVVTTPDAARALSAVPGRELAVAAPDAFSAAVLALLADPQRAASLGERGREYVARNHVWGELLAGFDHLLARPRSAMVP